MAGLAKFIFATPNVKRDRLAMRKWFVMFCVYLAAVAAASLWGFNWYSTTGSSTGRTIWLFGLYVFYLSLACTFVPIPTSWFVLFLASPVGGVAMWPAGRVLAVAAIGAFATAVAHINEYHVISYLMRLGKMDRVKRLRAYEWAERIFKLSPFLLQVTFNVIPIPADPARWAATIYGYPLGRFFLAHWVGRFIRYGLMAVAAEVIELTVVQIMLIQVALVVLAGANLAWRHVRSSRSKPKLVEDQSG